MHRRATGRAGVALALCCVIALAIGGCSRSGSATITPDYGAEQSTTYELRLLTQINHAVMLTGEKASLDELTLRFRAETIETTDDGGAIVAMHIERLTYRNSGESKVRVGFDSDRGDDQNSPPSMVPLFRAASAARVELRMSPDGAAEYSAGLEGVEALTATREDRDQLGTVFARDWWRELAVSVYRFGIDSDVVRAGDSWEESFRFAEQGYLTLSGLLERRVVSVTKDRVEVEESGGFTVDFSRDAFAADEPTSIDQQDISGRLVWDLAHGRLIEQQREVVLQLSQTWQGIVLAKRHAMSRSLRRVSGSSIGAPD